MPRLEPVPGDSDHPELQEIFGFFRERDREPPELYKVLANAPKMLNAWKAMAWPLRTDPETDRALRELMILRVAQLMDADYEWWAHEPMARAAGATDEQIASLEDWESADCFTAAEKLALRATDEMTRGIEASEQTVEALKEHYEPGEVIELLLTVAYYNCVSRMLHSLGMEPPA